MSEIAFIPLRPPAFDQKKSVSRLAQVSQNATLEYRCRVIVAVHLERYPPEAMGMLGEYAWGSIIKLKHERTAPDKGKRRTPAITERFLAAVEQENPHLAGSSIADKLVWKDIVDAKFPSNGLARPRGLLYPWPILVQRVARAGSDLLELYDTKEVGDKDKRNLERAVQVLFDTPMCVSLLQETEIGKTIKKFIKTTTSKKKTKAEELGIYTERSNKSNAKPMSPLQQLEDLLQSWKDMAAKSGVAIHDSSRNAAVEDDGDLSAAESCLTWRDLFTLLQDRETHRRVNQGVRMRESRALRAKNQPKIVKVRPAKAKHDAILHRPVGSRFGSSIASLPPSKNKFQTLRDESKVATTWQKSAPGAKIMSSSFGNAVAFSGVGKSAKGLKTGATKTLALAGGKRMKVPTKIPANTLKKKLSKGFRR